MFQLVETFHWVPNFRFPILLMCINVLMPYFLSATGQLLHTLYQEMATLVISQKLCHLTKIFVRTFKYSRKRFLCSENNVRTVSKISKKA